MKKKKFYITTAIDYVNAKPHIGHAFEKVLADALARWNRLLGKEVFFLTGVDENAQKNVEAAQKAGIPTKEFVNKNTGFFIELCKKLNLSHDAFIRTSAKEHAIVVQKIVKKMVENGDVYKGVYEGLYCTGCEAYYTEKDLVDGKCPEHNREPELRREDAYFFKLSKYKTKLLKLIPDYVVPESRRNEVIERVKGELNDICISRKGAKWGIDFPGDKDFKIWVWVDALINYYSGADGNWPADVHVIGKGINWFHSVIWPAILLSAEYKLPEKLLVHGYLTLSGGKISKSLGNVIDPLELIDKYGADAVRYSLLKCSVFDDSDYSEEILISRNNSELADKFGNLISRVTGLVEEVNIDVDTSNFVEDVRGLIENYELDKALNSIFAFIDTLNQLIQEKKLWEKRDKKDIYEVVRGIRVVTVLLWPFMPKTCEEIAKRFGFKISLEELNKPLKNIKIKKGEILFRKIETDKPKEQNINKPKQLEGIMTTGSINYSDWEKLELRVGKIIKAEDIDGADKLYKLEIDIGSEKRTVCAGIKQHYTKDKLKNKKVIIFTNLAPRMMRGIESKGMILAAVSEDEKKVVLISPSDDIEVGARVR